MDEKQLKTSPWQRVIICVVALLLLGSTVLTYLFIVMSSNNAKQSNDERIAQLEDEYDAKLASLNEVNDGFADGYFKDLQSYQKSQVKTYNAATANSEKLKINDLKVGNGREVKEGDTDYATYYLGWCPDGSIFDSSYNYAEDDTDKENPTGLKAPLAASSSMIEGWNQGVIGMKLGGVRTLAIPGELAYGDTKGDSLCGMTNAPLKFIVMALSNEDNEKFMAANEELNDAYIKLYTAMIGNSK